MQTFLPLASFTQSLGCLDIKRLGKQRIEAKQIFDALVLGSGPWYYHPATKMWKGFEGSLAMYHNLAIQLWIAKGYKNTMKFIDYTDLNTDRPAWFGGSKFHASHRSNLLRKNPFHYGKFCWKEPDDLPYIWPI